MPVLTKIECECGSGDGWRIDEDTAACWDCDTVCARIQRMPVMGGRSFMKGDGDNGGVYVKQLGRRFHSEKEMMSYAHAMGFEAVAPTDSKWKAIKDTNRNEADKDAKRDGFSSAQERADLIRNNKRDMVARARQKKIDKYHDEHGSEGKQTVDTAFGKLPE